VQVKMRKPFVYRRLSYPSEFSMIGFTFFVVNNISSHPATSLSLSASGEISPSASGETSLKGGKANFLMFEEQKKL